MALKELTAIQEYKLGYPNAQYDNDMLYQGEDVIVENADSLIEEYYDGFPITVAHPSGDPQLETQEPTDGRTYIDLTFNGNYAEAFNALG